MGKVFDALSKNVNELITAGVLLGLIAAVFNVDVFGTYSDMAKAIAMVLLAVLVFSRVDELKKTLKGREV